MSTATSIYWRMRGTERAATIFNQAPSCTRLVAALAAAAHEPMSPVRVGVR